MHLDNPAVRIQQTQQILDRLEKRLEKYYKPSDQSNPSSHYDELTDIKARLIKNICRNNTPKQDFIDLKYSKSVEELKHKPLIKSTDDLRQNLKDSPKKNARRESSSHHENDRKVELVTEIRELKEKLEKVEKRHHVKEKKLEREVHKLKIDLQKSAKLNRLLMKQLSPNPKKKDDHKQEKRPSTKQLNKTAKKNNQK